MGEAEGGSRHGGHPRWEPRTDTPPPRPRGSSRMPSRRCTAPLLPVPRPFDVLPCAVACEEGRITAALVRPGPGIGVPRAPAALTQVTKKAVRAWGSRAHASGRRRPRSGGGPAGGSGRTPTTSVTGAESQGRGGTASLFAPAGPGRSLPQRGSQASSFHCRCDLTAGSTRQRRAEGGGEGKVASAGVFSIGRRPSASKLRTCVRAPPSSRRGAK